MTISSITENLLRRFAVAAVAGLLGMPLQAAPDFDPDTDLDLTCVNLGGGDWRSTDYAFANMIHRIMRWEYVDYAKWRQGDYVGAGADELGWPTRTEGDSRQGKLAIWSNMRAISPAHHDPDTIFALGHYTLTWEGQGNLRLVLADRDKDGFWSNNTELEKVSEDLSGPVKRRVYNITGWPSNIAIQILETSPAPNHAKNIACWMPGYGDGTRVFHEKFLDRLAPFHVIRFMDWNNTNTSNTRQVEWSDRRRPDFSTFSLSFGSFHSVGIPGGVPYETMIKLCNDTGKHMWINIPYLASEDHGRQLARLIRDTLDPDLKLFLEYSNEMWNGTFIHMRGYGGDIPKDIYGQYPTYGMNYGWMSAKFFRIFEEEFAAQPNSQRPGLVKVLAGQGDNEEYFRDAMRVALDVSKPDVYGLTNYFGYDSSRFWTDAKGMNLDFNLDQRTPENLNRAIDNLEEKLLVNGALYSRWRHAVHMAAEFGMPVIAYEGGSHAHLLDGWMQTKEYLVQFMYALNSHPRMQTLYRRMLDSFNTAGAHMPNFFHLCNPWAPWGPWGILEYQEQPLDQAPRYRAAMEYALARGRSHIASPVLHPATVGYSYFQTIRAELLAGAASTTWEVVGSLPLGLRLSSSGEVGGVPTQAGDYTVTIRMTDNLGASDQRSFPMTVGSSPVPIRVGASDDAHTVNDAKGTPHPFATTLGNLTGSVGNTNRAFLKFPLPLEQLREKRVVKATLLVAPDYGWQFDGSPNLAVRRVDTDWSELTLTWDNAPVMGENLIVQTLPGKGSGDESHFCIDVTQYIAGKVEAGAANASFGLHVEGSGAASFKSKEHWDEKYPPWLDIEYEMGVAVALTIAGASDLPSAAQGYPWTHSLNAIGGFGTLVWTSVDLPSWLHLSATGVLSGTPPSAGQHAFTVSVSDEDQATDAQTFQLTVEPPPTPPPAPAGLVATPAGPNQINLTWQAVTSGGPVTYRVYGHAGTSFEVDDGHLLAESLAEPLFSDTGLARGATYSYAVTAVNLWDLESLPSAPVTAATSNLSQALFVAGNADTLSAGDNALVERLRTLGFEVATVSDRLSSTASAAGMDLVVISATVGSSNVSTKFTAVPVPVVVSEPWLLGNMGMIDTGANRYGNVSGVTQLTIAQPPGLPVGGLSGNVTVFGSAQTAGWAVPLSNALVAARFLDNPDRAAVFGFETGDNLTGLVCPARRAGLFTFENNSTVLTAAGWTLFDETIRWTTAARSDTRYTLTREAQHGVIQALPSRADYAQGAVVRLEAQPDPGYTFTGWSGDATGVDPVLMVTMSGNLTVIAHFELNVVPAYFLMEPNHKVSDGTYWDHWFGVLSAGSFPWVYHWELGWLYAPGSQLGWLYANDLDSWIWTRPEVFSWIYDAQSGGWLYYLRGTTNPRWFFNPVGATWEPR